MANTVYNVEEVLLADGTTVTLKPAVIKVLRKGNEMLNNFGDVKDEDEAFRKYLDIVCLCLKAQRPDFEHEVEEKRGGKAVTKTVVNYDLMEDLFDMDTVFKVIEVFLGVKLNDPKLLELAQKLMMEKAAEEGSKS